MVAAQDEVAGALRVLDDDGGWCWFEGERCVVAEGKLLVGAFCAALGAYATGSALVGAAAGVVGGVVRRSVPLSRMSVRCAGLVCQSTVPVRCAGRVRRSGAPV